MVSLQHHASDDAEFIALAERVINAESTIVSARVLHLVKIDSWFGSRWYSFTGKVMGAFGVHTTADLKIPPFHPHRVISETRFRLTDPPNTLSIDEPFHTLRSSDAKFFYSFGVFKGGDETVAGAWYSGNTAANGRGSIMMYHATREAKAGWYVGLERRDGWKLVRSVGIDHRHWMTVIDGVTTRREG
jgi:hypothetical protein